MRRKTLLSALLVSTALLPAPAAFGYIRLVYTDSMGSFAAIRPDNTGIQFYLNNLIAPGQVSNATGANVNVISSGSDPVGAAHAALATWNSDTGANIKFLPLKTTTAVQNSSDYLCVIVFATADDLSVLGYTSPQSPGVIAFTVSSVISGSGQLPNGENVVRGDIVDSDILLNPALNFSTDGSTGYDIQTVLTHELGHALGLNHTGLLGATMYQYNSIQYSSTVGPKPVLTERLLGTDEIDFANAVYPPSGPSTLGTISGKVVASNGSAVEAALLTLADVANGNTISGITASDGTYSLQLPPSSYVIYAEPMTTTSLVQPANIIALNAAQVTSNFLPTVLGGAASPTSVSVTAGNTTNAPTLTVTGGSNSLSLPYIGFGSAGGSGDITSFRQIGGPQTEASGQSLDIGFLGGGFDGTESIQIFGQGITITGAPHIDKSVNYSQGPLIRVTIKIASRQTPALASIFVSKATGSLSMSGMLVMVPPTPTFTANGVSNAASYKGNGVVSPGGISAIYDTVNNSLGPNPYVQNMAYDVYGNLPTSAGHVSVTFDGVPAPIFFAYAGQINVQVPFEVAGKTSTQVVVNYYGSQSAPVAVTVTPAQPAFFTFTPEGQDVIIQNFPDYSLNSASNPIARGGVVIPYGTGIGKLNYTLATGQPGVVPPSSYASNYSCSFGGQISNAYGYWNYGFVGEATWTVTVPANSPTGAVTLTCTDSVSGNSTQPATIYVK